MVTLTININKIPPRAREVLLGNSYGTFIIDYASNNLVTYDGKEEVEIFSFVPYFKMDNRYNRYEARYDSFSGNIIITIYNTRFVNE